MVILQGLICKNGKGRGLLVDLIQGRFLVSGMWDKLTM